MGNPCVQPTTFNSIITTSLPKMKDNHTTYSTDSDDDTYSDLPPLEDEDGNLADDGNRPPTLEVVPCPISTSDANLHKLTTLSVPGKERSDSSEQQHPQTQIGTQTTTNVTGVLYPTRKHRVGLNAMRSSGYFFHVIGLSLQQILEVASHRSTAVASRYTRGSDTTYTEPTTAGKTDQHGKFESPKPN